MALEKKNQGGGGSGGATGDLSNYATKSDLAMKVTKETGKSLVENELIEKLENLEEEPVLKTEGNTEKVFGEDGNYIPTVWSVGDEITVEKLNKVENAITSNRSILNEKVDDSRYIDLVKANARPSVVIDSGIVASKRSPISTFSGWVIPFRKTSINKYISGFETYVTVYDNSSNANELYNVELELYLCSFNVSTKTWSTTGELLAKTILVESGKCRFDFYKEADELPDVFGLLICVRQGVLFLHTGSYEGNYTDTDILCGYVTGGGVSSIATSNTNSYITTEFILYGEDEFRTNITIDDIPEQVTKSARFDLPNEINTVVGDNLELFVTGMVDALNPYNYRLKFIGNKGALYTRKYEYKATSSDVGSFNIICQLLDERNILQDSKNLKINVANKPTNPTEMKTVLFIGDSLTQGGNYPEEFLRRLTATDGDPVGNGLTNVQLCGTVVKSGNPAVKYEGYGGWHYKNYTSGDIKTGHYWLTVSASKPITYQKSIWKDANGIQWVLETLEENRIKVYRQTSTNNLLPSSGELVWVSGGDGVDNSNIVYSSVVEESSNPFWNDETKQIDMNAYMEKVGVDSIDYIYTLLGWNQVSDVDATVVEAESFLALMHEQLPNAKIILCGLQPPNPDGCATNYGLGYGTFYSQPREIRQHVADYNVRLEKLVIGKNYASFLHIACQYDYEYGSIMQTVPINNRVNTTICIGANGIHPGEIGHLQIADTIYRDFVHKLKS